MGFPGLLCAVPFIDLSAGCSWVALCSALSSGGAVSCADFGQGCPTVPACPGGAQGSHTAPGTAQGVEGLRAMGPKGDAGFRLVFLICNLIIS